MSSFRHKLFSVSGLLALGVLAIAIIMLSNAWLRGMRIDLTENNLYTVSEGTRSVLRNIEEPIALYLFYSERAARNAPSLRPYATRVREMLEEFSQHAGGKLRVQVLDPVPFSEEEDQAAQFGLQALPIQGGESVYLGLAGTNAVGDEAIIPFFDPGKEAFLEYDLAKLIYSLANPEKPVIGIMSSLPMGGDFDPQTRRSVPPWVIDEQIGQLFDVRDLSPTVTAIDEDVDVLMLVHPKDLSDETLYGIDQYIVRGGRALIFVDPHAEVDQPRQDPANPAAAFTANRSSSLSRLFDAWGIEISPTEVVGDDRYALQISTRAGAPPVRHLALLGLDSDALDSGDVITGDLTSLNLGMAGAIQVREDATATVVPLVSSSSEADLIQSTRMRFLSDPSSLRDGFKPGGEPLVLAARVTGAVPSAFPDGAPGDGDTEGHVAAADNINAIVVADVDMLADQFWVQVQNFFGQRIVSPWAGNGDFVINALDNLTGSSELIGIRSRATYRRPFDRVEELRRRADERFLAKEQELQDKLLATETKLTELQSGRADDNPTIMSDEQRAEIQRFLDERVEVRKELRRVRRDLAGDIENLGVWLKVVNIALMPLLVTLAALLFVWLRRRENRRAREVQP